MFVENDGSDYDRLRKLNNRIKHFDEDIEEAHNKGTLHTLPPTPLWVVDDGPECATATLRFAELTKIFADQSADAKYFAEDHFR